MKFFSNITDIFAIDLRSLALVRIILGATVCVDLVYRARDIAVFYGDGSVLPTQLLSSFWFGEWAWSLHALFGGNSVWVGVLFVVQALAALALMLGWRTTVASILTWILVVSLHNANSLILQGEDYLLRSLLFMGMFLPWGAALSLDRLRASAQPFRLVSGWSVAYVFHAGFFYYFASLYKSGPEWVENGSAIYYTLSIDQYATEFGRWLLQFPDLLVFLTFAIAIFQHIALFLLFLPVWNSLARLVAVGGLIGLHVALALTMHIEMFSIVAIAALVGLIPSATWNWLARHWSSMACLREERVAYRNQSLAMTLIGLLYIFTLFIWQVNQFVPIERVVSVISVPVQVARLDEQWNLFAPNPMKTDGWMVVEATLENGEQIDLFRGGAPVSYEKPERVYDLYTSTRWRKYINELKQETNNGYRAPYAVHLCETWNGEDGKPRVVSLKMVYMLELTVPPGETQGSPEPHKVFEWLCDYTTSQKLDKGRVFMHKGGLGRLVSS